MARSIWTGAISFGLVTVPVKLYSAVQQEDRALPPAPRATGVRIAQKRVDPSTGEEVPYEDIVKGYEIAPDRYVIIEPDDLEKLDPKKTRTIEIHEFVSLDDIDPIFYDHPYYLAPGAGGAKPYRLLLDAMRETRQGRRSPRSSSARRRASSRCARWGDVLQMATMLFADEIVDPTRIDELPDAEDVETTERELDIAKQLVDSLAGEFEPEQVPRRVPRGGPAAHRAEGRGQGDRRPAAGRGGRARCPDLMSALKASLDAVRDRAADDERQRRGEEARGEEARAAKKKAPAKSRAPKRRSSAAPSG